MSDKLGTYFTDYEVGRMSIDSKKIEYKEIDHKNKDIDPVERWWT